VLNTAAAIHTVANKSEFRKITGDLGISPPSIFKADDYDENMKWVVRPSTHSQGRHLYFVENEREFNNAIIQCGPGWYAGEYIPKVAEYRVCFVQGRVAWVAKKTPADPEAIAWNVAQGGRFDNVRWGEWPLGVVETAAEAFNVSGLDFSGVDVMVGPDGISYVLEANSAPSMTSDYRKTCITKCFDWIVNNGKEHLNQVRDRGWKGWIHPSLSGEAVV
jgi:glutathione synthase/RimK-type ligase-like ATP-grasp enzyme